MNDKSEIGIVPCDYLFENNSENNSTGWTSNDTSISDSSISKCQSEDQSAEKFATTANDFIREETLPALIWAAYKTFKYQPSDPLHYFAHQLLRWRHGIVPDRNVAKKANFDNTSSTEENLKSSEDLSALPYCIIQSCK